jgi:hypothetical protein
MMPRIPKSVLLAGPCSDDSFAENLAFALGAMAEYLKKILVLDLTGRKHM